ncbi:hypothetical protein B0A53_03146 [Rhodotorula sp. CCFEE 5036]|nr:hypothetical protein B0A53_03146 [Rhodotorula sp. CCFEE 5036]
MSDKITLQNLSAEQEADRLLAEEDEASRNNVLRDGLQQLEEEENLPTPATQNQTAAVKRIHPAPIIAIWIALSSAVILMNAWILSPKGEGDGGLGFPYPIFLTTTHLIYATIGTRLMRRFTHLIDGVDNIDMTWDRWYKNIVPIGLLFSASLIFSNLAYLSLGVSLKAFTSVAVLLMSVAMGLDSFNRRKAIVVLAISFGVALASYGELNFVFSGFIFQCFGIVFEATRLVAIQKLLQGMRMDPLVSLYYYAPVCACFNALLVPIFEGWAPFEEVLPRVGVITLILNCSVALCLNISVVFLIGCASSLVLTLSGVLKDILLVTGSVVLFGSPVTFVQLVGYSIALAGLFVFKTSPEVLAGYLAQLKALVGR